MDRQSLFVAAIFVGTSLTPTAWAGGQMEPASVRVMELSSAPASTPGTPQEETQYALGTKAMDEQRWADAVTAFDRVAAEKGKRATAALYWKAYSLDKLGRKDEARATCDALRSQQPANSWNRECFALRIRSAVDVNGLKDLSKQLGDVKVRMGDLKVDMADIDVSDVAFAQSFGGGDFDYSGPYILSDKHATSEDDIKMLALNSLMRSDPAKALPVLSGLVHSTKPIEIRRQALFVLSRSKDPQAEKIILDVATTKGDPELQRAAVQTLAINRGKDAGPTLVQIYRGASDASVKRAAVNGLFMTRDAGRLVELARSEKDLNLKRDIVSQLALMQDPAATDYMLELVR